MHQQTPWQLAVKPQGSEEHSLITTAVGYIIISCNKTPTFVYGERV
jgi:hypothetical protein